MKNFKNNLETLSFESKTTKVRRFKHNEPTTKKIKLVRIKND